MTVEREIKRGLFRLGQGTSSQIASFAETTPVAVARFLASRPDICASRATAGGDVADILWELREGARVVLRSELKSREETEDARSSGELDLDHERVRQSLDRTSAALEVLNELSDDDAVELVRSCQLRLGVAGRSLDILDDLGLDVTPERRKLTEVAARLDTFESRADTPLRAALLAEAAADLLASSFTTNVSDWLLSLARQIDLEARDTVRISDMSVPEAAAGLPMVILDGERTGSGGMRLLNVACTANAPALRVRVGTLDQSQREALLMTVAHHCSGAVGSHASVVFTFDSRDPATTGLLSSYDTFVDKWRVQRNAYDLGSEAFPATRFAASVAHVYTHACVLAGVDVPRRGLREGEPGRGSGPGAWVRIDPDGSPADPKPPKSFWIDAAEPTTAREDDRAGVSVYVDDIVVFGALEGSWIVGEVDDALSTRGVFAGSDVAASQPTSVRTAAALHDRRARGPALLAYVRR